MTTPSWTLARRADGRWLLHRSDGTPFVPLGVNHLWPPEEGLFAGRWRRDERAWARSLIDDLAAWGFNSAGYDPHSLLRGLPWFGKLRLHEQNQWRQPGPFAWIDPFAEGEEARIAQAVTGEVAKAGPDVQRIGWFWTDLTQWGIEAARRQRGAAWCDALASLGRDRPGHRAWEVCMEERFGSLDRAIRRRADPSDPAVRAADEAFLGRIAERHYGQVAAACARVCPGELQFGDVLWAYDPPEPVLRALARQVDVISIQWGPQASPFAGQGFEARLDTAELDRVAMLCGRPVLIADHSISFPDPSRLATLWHQEASQEEAALAMGAFLTACASHGAVLGHLRCMYHSEWSPWRSLLKQGLVDEAGRPYRSYVAHIAQANRAAQAAWLGPLP